VIVKEFAANAENASGCVGRDLHLPNLIAFLRRRQEMLLAILDPFHGAIQNSSGRRDERLLRIKDQLGPEAAADVRRYDRKRSSFSLSSAQSRLLA